MPNMVLMLNEHRQIVYANLIALETLGVGVDALLGKRPGEAVGCIHAHEESGCGTTEFCATCGAAVAIASSLAGEPEARECRIPVESPKPDLDLRVWATPFRHEDFSFTVFAAVDISHEKRRRVLEHIFFHDVLNTAAGLKGLAGLIADSSPADMPELARLLGLSSEQLVDEILSYRDLAAIESGEFRPHPTRCSLKTFLNTTARLCETHEAARGRAIVVQPGVTADSIVTDRALLMRVMGNMIKNALEAEPEGAVIRIGADRLEDGRWAVWVRNPTVIPRTVQLQVFQRSFSTKGDGRGLGTYSIRLLTERFLGGTASFTSAEGTGTEFRITIPSSILT
jgi:signal transduction histidine kinase